VLIGSHICWVDCHITDDFSDLESTSLVISAVAELLVSILAFITVRTVLEELCFRSSVSVRPSKHVPKVCECG